MLWHGWLLGLGTAGERAWSVDRQIFGTAGGRIPADSSEFWNAPDFWDADDLAVGMEDHPCVWTDGREQCPAAGCEVAGAGVFLPAPEKAFRGAAWNTVEEYGDARLERCRAFMPVPGPLQTVQHAELWGAILALQASWPGHLGTDNLNVVRSIGRLLDHGGFSTRLPLVKDGDLIDILQHMIRARGANTVQVTEVKGHATDADFDQGRVRGEDGLGNAEADTAAVFGRRHQPESVMDVGGGFCFRYRFMIAVSRVTVNHDGRGGTAPDPLVWDQGSWRKHRKVDIRVPSALHAPKLFLDL